MQNGQVCQSCGMPLTEEVLGTERDGSKNEDYCVYCYKEGAFVTDCDMEEMIDICVPFMEKEGMNKEKARKLLENKLPKLKRWKHRSA